MSVALPNPGQLTEAERQELDTWLTEFERFWEVGRLDSIIRFLPERGSALRPVLLVELVKIDMRRQWQRGLRVTVESYLMCYRELGTVDTVLADLVRAEFEVRRQFGAPASWDDFRQRFPRQVAQLQGDGADDTGLPFSETLPQTPPSGSFGSDALSLTPPKELTGKFGRYEIISLLGRGGMGTVYLAEDTQLKRRVALKVPHGSRTTAPRILERFYREARAAATLVHPNICPVYDVGEWQGVHYLTMAYIEGKPLTEYARSDRPHGQRWAAEVVYRLALALAEAHAHGVVHRDLKPANVIVNQRGDPVLMDFGLARLFHESSIRLTQSGLPIGTPWYMAPEQIAGKEDADAPACDIYSLGVILYELLTGRVPFPGTMAEVMTRVLVDEAEPPSRFRPDLDPRLEAICLKAMAKEVAHRYPDMGRLAADLADFLDAAPAATPATAPAFVEPASQHEIPTLGPCETPAELPSVEAPPIPVAPPESFAETEEPSAQPCEPAPAKRYTWLVAGTSVALAACAVLVALLLVRGGSSVGNEAGREAAKQAPGEPVTGEVRFVLSDPNATVDLELDGLLLDRSGLEAPLQLHPGPHRVRVSGKGVEPAEVSFRVQAGAPAEVSIPVAVFGSVAFLLSDPHAEVSVEVDGKPLAAAMSGVRMRLRVGEHRLRVVGRDVDPVEQTFSVAAGESLDLPVKLNLYGRVPLDLGPGLDEIDAEVDGKRIRPESFAEPLRLAVGKHELRLSGRYVDPVRQSFDVRPGSNAPLVLRPACYGLVRIELSEPAAAAEIAVDGRVLGPDERTGAVRLPVGEHEVRVSGPRHRPVREVVRVVRGENPVKWLTVVPRDPIELGDPRFTNSLGTVLIRIPEGKFMMGSPESEEQREDDEALRPVTIAKPFYLGAHEVRVREFKAFVKATGYKTDAERSGQGAWRWREDRQELVRDRHCTWLHPGYEQGEDHPVVCVTWKDAQKFCEWLSSAEGRRYRLPTEAEWEYACRAGTSTPFYFGGALTADKANFNGKFPYRTSREGRYLGRAAKTGSYPRNSFGLYDMHGNVWEWCADRYTNDTAGKPRQGGGQADTDRRVLRGGSWIDPAKFCRSAYRSYEAADQSYPYVGFRVLCEATLP